MSGIPDEIPDYGDIQLKPIQNPDFVPGAGFGTEEYFVWSRCDGVSSLRDVILSSGFATSKSIALLTKLRHLGALLLPYEKEAPIVTKQESNHSDQKESIAVDTSMTPPGEETDVSDFTEEERDALSVDHFLDRTTRLRIIELKRRLAVSTFFETLEIESDADQRSVKRAYYRLSREFHPDRYFGKELGPFGPWLVDVFKRIATAFDVLGNNRKRAAYEAELRGTTCAQPQTKKEHALVLFHDACDAELRGDGEQALKLFAASLRGDEQSRHLRRAAMCAVHCKELNLAEQYAKRAVELQKSDASYLRVLADVYRAGSRLEEAVEVLERALHLNTENDVLFGELQSDYQSVLATIAEKVAENESQKHSAG